MKLNDEVIAHVAKILQLALITGTDIVDHMRMIVLKASDEELYLDEEYVKNSNSNIEKMLQEAASNMSNQEGG
jgi:hypothetical protein